MRGRNKSISPNVPPGREVMGLQGNMTAASRPRQDCGSKPGQPTPRDVEQYNPGPALCVGNYLHPKFQGRPLPHLTPCGTGRARDAGLVHLVAAKKAVCGAGCLQAFDRRATGRYQTLGFGMRSRRVSACFGVRTWSGHRYVV
ncbi:hypothetical protein CH63R_00808 [Colletotrichum higginsianum IMI 349063]|uniref:Uncharacterized protein n=1 Tax=Colletotrichum higginsianum (strain IMI 349063) TaxID=759273 RepID=A0A1B7YUS2_COLHI|nr:hypothetical protein CH63R_00808 [Colletotrichum higginsianum IMI 349063]OBR15628.1 hypothetical protein CH63R_00808 [Colletotrichum higginsianum IMI 349063]